MVELICSTETRTEKLKRDVKKMLKLHREAVTELQESGQWSGGLKARALSLINWYQAQNACNHCIKHPETSFSTRVRIATEHSGVAAGTAEFLRLWKARTQGSLI